MQTRQAPCYLPLDMMVNAVDSGYDALIDELSRVFAQPGEAHELAQRAGFPAADVPNFVNPTVFWGHLVRAAANGKLFGGVGSIVAQAKLRFPHNPVFAAHGSKTVVAPAQPGLRLVHAVDPPAPPAAPPSAATSTSTSHSPFAPHLPHASSPPTPQPMRPVEYTGRDARDVIIDTSTHTDNRKGLGSAGVASIVLVVGAALCTMGWLAFDAIKGMPRNSDGSVTVWGVFTLPPGVVGEPPPVEEREEEPRTVSGPMTLPIAAIPAPAVTTRKEIEGVWRCSQNRIPPIMITFTEAGRAAFSHAKQSSFLETPFAKWTDQPYTIVSARTIEVAGMPVQVEVSADGQALRAVGGNEVFNCKKVVL